MKKLFLVLILAGGLLFPLASQAQVRGEGYCKVFVNGWVQGCSNSGTVVVSFSWTGNVVKSAAKNYSLTMAQPCQTLEFHTLAQAGSVNLQTVMQVSNDDAEPITQIFYGHQEETGIVPNKCSTAGNQMSMCAAPGI